MLRNYTFRVTAVVIYQPFTDKKKQINFKCWLIKAETHDARNCCETLRRQVTSSALLSLQYVTQIQTSLNSCDRSQRQNYVAATMIFTCQMRQFVAATCRGDMSQRFVALCVSAFKHELDRLKGIFWSVLRACKLDNTVYNWPSPKINLLKFQMFTLCWCTTEVHHHGGSIYWAK